MSGTTSEMELPPVLNDILGIAKTAGDIVGDITGAIRDWKIADLRTDIELGELRARRDQLSSGTPNTTQDVWSNPTSQTSGMNYQTVALWIGVAGVLVGLAAWLWPR